MEQILRKREGVYSDESVSMCRNLMSPDMFNNFNKVETITWKLAFHVKNLT